MKLVRLLLLAVVATLAFAIAAVVLYDPVAVDSFTVSDAIASLGATEAVASLPQYGEVKGFVGTAMGWSYVGAIMLLLFAVTVLSIFREAIVTAVVGSTRESVVDIGYDILMGFFPPFLLSPPPKSASATTQPRLVFDPRAAPVDWSELDGNYGSSYLFERELARFRSKHNEHFPEDMLTNDLLRFFRSQQWLSGDGGTVIFLCREDVGRMAS